MGALDFLKEFEGRVLDAASYKKLQRNYELQEENNRQLQEKIKQLEDDNANLHRQVEKILSENKMLQEKIANLDMKDQFVTYKGFAFKRGQDGKFEETGYCPNCYSIMGKVLRRTYRCPKCEYTFKADAIPEFFANKLNEKSK
ncbi:MAG: hypothetical protein ACTSQ8_25595 [Candidatus Helarchaeota archaeon]